jgi:putative membrane protein
LGAFAGVLQNGWRQTAQGDRMNYLTGNSWYFWWGWILWIGFMFLIFSSFGNWGYTYRAHRKYDQRPTKQAIDILDERYARGDITREQYRALKSDIASTSK